jgi:glucan 1,3-beta-glucosidase
MSTPACVQSRRGARSAVLPSGEPDVRAFARHLPPPMSLFLRHAIVLAVAVGGAIGAVAYWSQRGQPAAMPDAPEGRLQCVSYSPYRLPGETPHERGFRVRPERVDEDLARLAAETRCVRTYSVQQGLDAVPEAARRHGLKVWLGVWIGRDALENEREIAIAADLARRYPDVVAAIVVGNEVLLRREQPPERMAQYLREMRRAAPGVPVTYADVWEFWIRHPALAAETDFVTVHMLPYWEDDPIAIGQAVGHALAMYDFVRTRFPGKEIAIGEAGWPSAGRHRRGAVPSTVNQARFVREFAAAAAARGIRYNLIEAFDQPWKRAQEGAVGGYWGLFDSAGRAKFPLKGPVAEDARWLHGFAAMGIGMLAFFLAGRARGVRGAGGAALLVSAGIATGGALLAQWCYMVVSNRDVLEWLATGACTVAAALAALLAAISLGRWLQGEAPRPLAAWHRVRTGETAGADAALGTLRALLLLAAAVTALLMVLDPRYRDFPLPLHLVPAAAFALLALAGATGRPEIEERVAAAWIALSAPLVVAMERPDNLHALAWLAVALAYAAPVLAVWRAAGRARTSTPSAKPAAERSGL